MVQPVFSHFPQQDPEKTAAAAALQRVLRIISGRAASALRAAGCIKSEPRERDLYLRRIES